MASPSSNKSSHAANASSITGDILLEAGTNELEVLVFQLAGQHYGVNVAKVREVIRPQTTTAAPGQHPSVIGMFNIRGSVIPVVDLARHLGLRAAGGQNASAASHASAGPEGRVIITEFNGLRTGFMVDSVDQIHRLSWSRVRPAPALGGLATPDAQDPRATSSTTGIVELTTGSEPRLILMIDFESVADAILMQGKLKVQNVPNDVTADRAGARVLLAEDSPFMRSVIEKVFRASGYARLEIFDNGAALWEAAQAGPTPAAIVSDIEMPRMDGLHLCKRIKADPRLAKVPVVLFSSLISQDNLNKGAAVGADMQVSKPELAEMVRLVDRAITGELAGPVAVTPKAAA
jgi:two-component system chemotaxis response regulator CheV